MSFWRLKMGVMKAFLNCTSVDNNGASFLKRWLWYQSVIQQTGLIPPSASHLFSHSEHASFQTEADFFLPVLNRESVYRLQAKMDWSLMVSFELFNCKAAKCEFCDWQHLQIQISGIFCISFFPSPSLPLAAFLVLLLNAFSTACSTVASCLWVWPSNSPLLVYISSCTQMSSTFWFTRTTPRSQVACSSKCFQDWATSNWKQKCWVAAKALHNYDTCTFY